MLLDIAIYRIAAKLLSGSTSIGSRTKQSGNFRAEDEGSE
jgi:hypothetical protein